MVKGRAHVAGGEYIYAFRNYPLIYNYIIGLSPEHGIVIVRLRIY
jgi:hypothetical protein